MTAFDMIRLAAFATLLIGLVVVVGAVVFAVFLFALNIWRNSQHAAWLLRQEREGREAQQDTPSEWRGQSENGVPLNRGFGIEPWTDADEPEAVPESDRSTAHLYPSYLPPSLYN
jgi:hypothetical protein